MKKLILTIIISAIVFSCDDRLEEMNKPTKNAEFVPGVPLFSSGVRNMFDMMVSTNVNENVFRLYAQYWAQTTYPDESQYNMVNREIPDNFWRNAYRDALKDLDESRQIIESTWQENLVPEPVKTNQIAIIDVCKAFVFSVLVDAFGAVPFDEALNPEILIPAYDPGAEVYDKVIAMLDNAIVAMDDGEAAFPEAQDPVYEGDVEAWMKFANSLKLRLALNISDVDPGKAQTMITEALSGGVFESNDDNASITYYSSPPNTNPVWEDLVQSGRRDYVMANTVINALDSLLDPRILVFAGTTVAYAFPEDDDENYKDSTFTTPKVVVYRIEDEEGDTEDSVVFAAPPFTIAVSDTADAEIRVYSGGIYGNANTFSARSRIGSAFYEPDREGVILDYAEVEFLLAEAAAKGLTVPGTVEEHYNAGIAASMEYWGIDDADIADYLANPDVAYTTAPGDWKQKIGTQAWLAFYNRGFEGWTVWRRLDFEGFNPPPGLEAEDIPKRLIFPIEEATLNPSNLQAAKALVGADNAQMKVFWDVN